MSQFDLYVNTDKETRETYPYFVDVQHGLLDNLNSRTVIPLTPIEQMANAWPRHLCPVFRLGTEDFALLTHQLTSVSVSLLITSEGSLSEYRSEIISAIDFLITGI